MNKQVLCVIQNEIQEYEVNDTRLDKIIDILEGLIEEGCGDKL